jgi:hypothetical protein
VAAFFKKRGQLLAVTSHQRPVVVALLDVDTSGKEHEVGALLTQPRQQIKGGHQAILPCRRPDRSETLADRRWLVWLLSGRTAEDAASSKIGGT